VKDLKLTITLNGNMPEFSKDRFKTFMPIILRHEGGYVNDPDDLGGETNYGITKRRYPNLNIKALTVTQAEDIYYKDFYKPLNLHLIKDDLLALHIFDMAINAGRKRAVKLLQSCLNGITQDGIIGPWTAKLVAAAGLNMNMIEIYKAKRYEYYYKVSLLRRNSKFLKGWIRRIDNTYL